MFSKPRVFPLEDFNATFPCFSAEGSGFTSIEIQMAGKSAMHHIGEEVEGFPLRGEEREYALFLMTAHILTLHKKAKDSISSGQIPTGGMAFKSTIGSVSIENTKPNSFTVDDWSYWLNQTIFGQELLALLEVEAPLGIYLNIRKDSVRVLK